MITKERLEQLCTDEKYVYCGVNKIKLRTVDFIENDKLYYSIGNDKFFCMNLEFVCEDKKESDFILEFYKSRVERFKPPYILCYGDIYQFNSKKYGECKIAHIKDSKDADIYTVVACDFVLKTNSNFNTYQDALYYAMTLFEGDLNDN